MPICFVWLEERAPARSPEIGLPRSLYHVNTAAKKESQAQSILALSQMSQTGSYPSKAVSDLPSGSEDLVQFLLPEFLVLASPVMLAPHELGALTQPRSPTHESCKLEKAQGARDRLASFRIVGHNQRYGDSPGSGQA
jgi:hypothetical protein